MTVFEAYITNLGKYAEGRLVGETLKISGHHGGGAIALKEHRRGRCAV